MTQILLGGGRGGRDFGFPDYLGGRRTILFKVPTFERMGIGSKGKFINYGVGGRQLVTGK